MANKLTHGPYYSRKATKHDVTAQAMNLAHKEFKTTDVSIFRYLKEEMNIRNK